VKDCRNKALQAQADSALRQNGCQETRKGAVGQQFQKRRGRETRKA
jgi:hypothetical protein